MAQQPMSQGDLHNAIVDLRAQNYAIEIMVGRLYLLISQTQEDPEAFFDEVLETVTRDVDNMHLTPPYSEEAAANMRAKIRERLRDLVNAAIPQSPRQGRN